jgi:hypothetical protein
VSKFGLVYFPIILPIVSFTDEDICDSWLSDLDESLFALICKLDINSWVVYVGVGNKK